MKLESVRVFVVGNPPPSFGGRYFIFLKLRTSCGVEGVGEVYAATFGPHVVAKMIEDVFARRFAGQDPTQIEAVWRRVHGSGYTLRPDPSLMGVISGLEMACWDIAGKAADRPVYNLLGGLVRERLRTYTYIYPEEGESEAIYRNAERSVERALDYIKQGFTALKFDPAGAYSAFDPRQPDLFSLVARATSIPIATGERLTTKYEFARVLSSGAASILQMNLGRVGGLLEAKKIAGMAEAHYALIAPHLYCGPVVGAANIQLSACIPNFLILESIERWDGFHAKLLKTPIRWEEGYVIPPSAPGLGVEIDEAVALAHPYPADGRLHLEMADAPVG
jgi:L-alanine-DL-glutamate epimerase-like enolase superfamily enzyme